MAYLLQDEFTTDRAAGSVNGTAPEPGPGGNRVAVQNDGTIALTSGSAVFVGQTTPAESDLYLRYSAQTRAAGMVLRFSVNRTLGTQIYPGVGFYNATTPTDSAHQNGFHFATSTTLRAKSAGSGISVLDIASSTNYELAVVLRAAGAMFFIKVSGIWRLLWTSTTGNSATVYPTLVSWDAGASYDYIRIPTDLWLPTPLASDGFPSAFGTTDGTGHAETSGLGSGGSGLTWTGATWSVSGAKAVNTPGLGSELVVNGDFAVDANWTKGAGWTIAGGVGVATGASSTAISQAVVVTGVWYRAQFDLVSISSGSLAVQFGGGSAVSDFIGVVANGIIRTRRASGTAAGLFASGTAVNATIDNVSFKALTFNDLFSSVSASTADVVADVNVVVTSGTQAGLVLNLDSTSSPANFVIAYHDGTNAKLEKCVAGTYTTVITAAATYSAGATLRVAKIGTAYRLYYNNALVGSGTISDAGIISNTRHGLFSTYSANTLDNFVVYASGSGGEYATLDTLGAGGIIFQRRMDGLGVFQRGME